MVKLGVNRIFVPHKQIGDWVRQDDRNRVTIWGGGGIYGERGTTVKFSYGSHIYGFVSRKKAFHSASLSSSSSELKMVGLNKESPLGTFPLGSHDSWQYHFYAAELNRFFSVRMWTSNSVRQAWSWTSTAPGDKSIPGTQSLIAHLDACEFQASASQEVVAAQASQPGTVVSFTELSNVTHAGILSVSVSSTEVLHVKFTPKSTHFWAVPGQTQGVFHFPNISADITYEGQTVHAYGYCKRYWGNYDGPWGYQFIQGGSADESTAFWTADATFGDDEYNYFKVVTSEGGLTVAERTDTYHNNQRAFWRPIGGSNMEAELTECAKMEFLLKSDKMYSKLVERFGRVQLKKDGEVVFSGCGFNEICFGTVA